MADSNSGVPAKLSWWIVMWVFREEGGYRMGGPIKDTIYLYKGNNELLIPRKNNLQKKHIEHFIEISLINKKRFLKRLDKIKKEEKERRSQNN